MEDDAVGTPDSTASGKPADPPPGRQATAPVDAGPVADTPPEPTGRAATGKAAPTKRAAPAAKKATPAKKTTATKAATTAKKTAVAKAASAGKATSGQKAASAPKTTSVQQESGRTPGEGWRAVAARLLDHPGYAPELLALAAVDALGPIARDWVERTRGTYPDADADGLARLVTRRFVRLAGTGGVFAAGAGLLAPVAELAAALWTQASLVLHLAAVYGRDPGHADRAAELLVLTQVHPDTGTAHAALDTARSAGAPVDGPWPRAAEAAWRLAMPLAAQTGGWLGLRVASRLLPGAAVLAAAAGDSAAAERLAARAVARYRPARVRPAGDARRSPPE
ncbi:hypothetical protein [Micromonospora narathiwatensis]|uniref:EcsC protein family protein n=1 Tax=Micromonospora narathiwatensis TaxID=299146 RepID=A0A1A9A8N8_9ACTN|nr:hypothetical protein [Micromonospora narathiwatensis]SBT52846.1 hypothetical protein GA0070621_4571 [Micromonospora narathiwatensis]